MIDFQTQLAERASSVMFDTSNDSRVLQVAFGGINGGLAMAPFEFYKLTADLPTKKLFIRDLSQSWYHGTLPDIGHGADDLVAFLREWIAAHDIERVVFFGNSMGGYAAILLGWLLGVDEIIAFAPQTFINRTLRLWHRDTRWKAEIFNTYASHSANPAYFDLYRVLASRRKSVMTRIYVDTRERLDRIHAEHLEKIPSVQIHSYQTGGHELVKYLRNQGILREILLQALSPTPAKGA